MVCGTDTCHALCLQMRGSVPSPIERNHPVSGASCTSVV